MPKIKKPHVCEGDRKEYATALAELIYDIFKEKKAAGKINPEANKTEKSIK